VDVQPAVVPPMMASVDGENGSVEIPSRLESVYRAEAPHVWRALYAYTGGRRDVADDALAEAFARALVHDGRIRDPLAWVYRVAFRVAAAELRAARREGGDTPDRVVEAHETSAIVEALRHLSPNQRAAIVLHYEVDLPVHEVARRMGLRPATVRVHLHRGRTRLRALLADEEDER
jgi:RNA polymerase sigma-70 factor, ECF subfamily